MPAVPLGPVLCRNVLRFSILERREGRSSPVSFQPVAGRLGPNLGPILLELILPISVAVLHGRKVGAAAAGVA